MSETQMHYTLTLGIQHHHLVDRYQIYQEASMQAEHF